MKKGTFRISGVIFSLAFAALILLPNIYAEIEGIGEEIKLYMGETKNLSVNNPTRIALGNPSILDIASVSKNDVVLNPKAPGKTTLIIWDNFGEQAYQVKVFAYDISEAKRRIDNLLAKLNLADVRTQAEEDEGKVVLLGRVKTPQEKERISVVLGSLKEKTVDLVVVKEEEAVVEIDVQLLELNNDATKTLGLTWPGNVELTEVGSPGLTSAKWSTLFKVLAGNRDAFTVQLDALTQEGKARILSRPRLACQSGKEAELLVGGEKPIFTTQVAATTGNEATQVEYKEYGIKLKIKPTVVDDERIKLALNVEVSEVGAAETIGNPNAPSAKAYPLNKRNASTELFMNDGQSMAIGGLIKHKAEDDVRKTPFLGDIPIIGGAFRKNTHKEGGGQGERGNSELFIILTPKIIAREKAPQPVKQVAIKQQQVTLSQEELLSPQAKYAQMVKMRILNNLVYPAKAKEASYQGTVKLGLRLSYRGELLDAKVDTSSGYKILDENALATARNTASYPPFPPSIEQQELWINVAIDYRLD